MKDAAYWKYQAEKGRGDVYNANNFVKRLFEIRLLESLLQELILIIP